MKKTRVLFICIAVIFLAFGFCSNAWGGQKPSGQQAQKKEIKKGGKPLKPKLHSLKKMGCWVGKASEIFPPPKGGGRYYELTIVIQNKSEETIPANTKFTFHVTCDEVNDSYTRNAIEPHPLKPGAKAGFDIRGITPKLRNFNRTCTCEATY